MQCLNNMILFNAWFQCSLTYCASAKFNMLPQAKSKKWNKYLKIKYQIISKDL